MTGRDKVSGGAKSKGPQAVAKPRDGKPDPLPVKEAETARQERAQGGFPNLSSSKDPNLGPA